jgi:hypothetical protein
MEKLFRRVHLSLTSKTWHFSSLQETGPALSTQGPILVIDFRQFPRTFGAHWAGVDATKDATGQVEVQEKRQAPNHLNAPNIPRHSFGIFRPESA